MGHLADVNQSYLAHFRRAVFMAIRFLVAVPLLLVHAFLPNLFTTAAKDAVNTYHRLTEVDDV
ncbi:MAG: hypothetical protein ISP84_01580 [Candidatus Poseidonia sp.]|nr:hypothetical protein [Poseidonia sp.]